MAKLQILLLLVACLASFGYAVRPTVHCKPHEIGARFPHPIDCRKFLTCTNRLHFEFYKCPKGLHFNEKLQVCDFPSNAGCSKQTHNNVDQCEFCNCELCCGCSSTTTTTCAPITTTPKTTTPKTTTPKTTTQKTTTTTCEPITTTTTCEPITTTRKTTTTTCEPITTTTTCEPITTTPKTTTTTCEPITTTRKTTTPKTTTPKTTTPKITTTTCEPITTTPKTTTSKTTTQKTTTQKTTTQKTTTQKTSTTTWEPTTITNTPITTTPGNTVMPPPGSGCDPKCCNQPDGSTYPRENYCGYYVICQGQKEIIFKCPNNLHYNPLIERCDYPVNANCPWDYTPPSGPSAGPSGIYCAEGGRCVRQADGKYFAMTDGKCDSKYIICQCECEVERECPTGLVFNVQLGSCDWPKNVNCS